MIFSEFKVRLTLLFMLLALLAFACSGPDQPLLSPTAAPDGQPTSAPPTSVTEPPTATPEALFYNLPPAQLTDATGLYASPNRGELTAPTVIPAGETIYVMGRNSTGSHLRAVWNTAVGWLPVSFTTLNGQTAVLNQLPVFEREPPACAEPLTTQFSLNSKWSSDFKQRIAIVVDIFRARFGDFPAASLALVVNGTVVESSRRQIVEQGQFTLKDVVFALPQDVQPGDVVSYQLDTSSDEPLTFTATVFKVPNDCKWKID